MAKSFDGAHRGQHRPRKWFCIVYIRQESYDAEKYPRTGYAEGEPVHWIDDEYGQHKQFASLEEAKAFLPHVSWKEESDETGVEIIVGTDQFNDYAIRAFTFNPRVSWN